MSEQTTKPKAYPVDAQDYRFNLNLRTPENPLIVEHVWRRLPLKDKAGADWIHYEKMDAIKARTTKGTEQQYEGRAVSSRLWLANQSTIKIKGYPPPIGPADKGEAAVDSESIKSVPYDHRERAAQIFLDVECERLESDDELALLLGSGATGVEVKHLGFTFKVWLNKTEEGRIYFDAHVSKMGSKREGKSSVTTYGYSIENACKLFDKWFDRAEDVEIADGEYTSAKREDFLREFCPLLKLKVVEAVFEQANRDAGN